MPSGHPIAERDHMIEIKIKVPAYGRDEEIIKKSARILRSLHVSVNPHATAQVKVSGKWVDVPLTKDFGGKDNWWNV